MAQVFRRQANLLIALGLIGVFAAIVFAAALWHLIIAQPYALGAPVVQPVPFSHKHHVVDDGIDCRYCHTSVEDSAFAGIPPTETCMTCHSQLFTDAEMLAPVVNSMAKDEPLEWRRVHDLPDFVYFQHGVHVNNGIGCSSCHGRVDRMPLVWQAEPSTMQWCLACHRDPSPHLRPADKVFDMGWTPPASDRERRRLAQMLMETYAIETSTLTDCSICHR